MESEPCILSYGIKVRLLTKGKENGAPIVAWYMSKSELIYILEEHQPNSCLKKIMYGIILLPSFHWKLSLRLFHYTMAAGQ